MTGLSDLFDKGYQRIVDFTIFKNDYLLSHIGFFYVRENKDRTLDLVVVDGDFLNRNNINFKKIAYKKFNSQETYEIFMNYVKPYDELPAVPLCTNWHLIIGAPFGSGIFNRKKNNTLLNHLVVCEVNRYLSIVDEFTFGEEALEMAKGNTKKKIKNLF